MESFKIMQYPNTTGITENVADLRSIYPNPASNSITVQRRELQKTIEKIEWFKQHTSSQINTFFFKILSKIDFILLISDLLSIPQLAPEIRKI